MSNFGYITSGRWIHVSMDVRILCNFSRLKEIWQQNRWMDHWSKGMQLPPFSPFVSKVWDKCWKSPLKLICGPRCKTENYRIKHANHLPATQSNVRLWILIFRIMGPKPSVNLLDSVLFTDVACVVKWSILTFQTMIDRIDCSFPQLSAFLWSIFVNK